MAKGVVRFSSIGQYRDIISSVTKLAAKDKLSLPTLHFRGLVKLHGTNACIVYDPTTKSETKSVTNDGIMIQSRNNVYPPILKANQDKDASHMGFNGFAHQPIIVKIVEEIYESCISFEAKTKPELMDSKMLIYGEWAGKGIMKNVAISEFEKGFYIFGVRLIPQSTSATNSCEPSDSNENKGTTEGAEDDADEYQDGELEEVSKDDVWIDIAKIKLPVVAKDARIFNLIDFQHWELDIDFNFPKAVQNKLVDITNEVEKVCPVGFALGKTGCGEGVVWQTEWRGYRLLFKVKGTKHSVSKVKTLASVDPEEHASIQSFIEYAVTENRIDQALHEVEQTKGQSSRSLRTSDIGDLMKWIIKDILKEESDVLKKSNLEWTKVAKHVSTKARTLFLAKLGQA